MSFLFTWPNESWHAVGTWTGSTDPIYPATNMKLGDPTLPTRITTPGAGYLNVDLGQAATLDGCALIGHTFNEASQVYIQGSTNAGFTAIVINSPFVMQTPRADGSTPNPWQDWRTVALGNRTARYWRIVVPYHTAATALVGVLWLPNRWYQLSRGIQWSSRRMRTRQAVVHRTDGGARMGYDFGVTIRKLTGQTLADYSRPQDDGPPYGERDVLEHWWDACRGSLRPMVIVPDDTDAWSGAWYVTWDGLSHEHSREPGLQANFPLAFEEVPNGVWITPTA